MANRCKNCGWSNTTDRENCEKCNAPLSTDVFISYSRKDYVVNNIPIADNVIQKIKNAFDENNISYWFDEDGIYSGDEFAGVITRAIRTSKIFLFVSSANSNQSLWTSNEISTALEYKKIIIPFRLDNSLYNDSVMMKIVSLDRIDCDNHEIAIAKLLRAVRHHIPETKRANSRIIEIPQSAKGATVIMDVGGKRIEHIISFDETKTDYGKPHPTTSFKSADDNNLSEYKSPSDVISVHIADKKTPIMMLMGPTAVGKTMTLVRLVRYLIEQGYSVQPDRIFRPTNDIGYGKLCDSFQELINSAYAANGTLGCMLIKIVDRNGRSVLQIIDIAGELYYNESNSTPLPSFLLQILHSSNPFIWAFMIEPYWRDSAHRIKNVEKIRNIKQKFFKHQDKAILVCNKIDKLPPFREAPNHLLNPNHLLKLIRDEYPGMLEIFENVNPITKLFKKYNCSIVPFCTGYYTQSDNGRTIYTTSQSNYPYMLWKELTKY